MIKEKENTSNSSLESEHSEAASDTPTSPPTTDESTPVEENAGASTILSSNPILGVQDSESEDE